MWAFVRCHSISQQVLATECRKGVARPEASNCNKNDPEALKRPYRGQNPTDYAQDGHQYCAVPCQLRASFHFFPRPQSIAENDPRAKRESAGIRGHQRESGDTIRFSNLTIRRQATVVKKSVWCPQISYIESTDPATNAQNLKAMSIEATSSNCFPDPAISAF